MQVFCWLMAEPPTLTRNPPTWSAPSCIYRSWRISRFTLAGATPSDISSKRTLFSAHFFEVQQRFWDLQDGQEWCFRFESKGMKGNQDMKENDGEQKEMNGNKMKWRDNERKLRPHEREQKKMKRNERELKDWRRIKWTGMLGNWKGMKRNGRGSNEREYKDMKGK